MIAKIPITLLSQVKLSQYSFALNVFNFIQSLNRHLPMDPPNLGLVIELILNLKFALPAGLRKFMPNCMN